MTALAPAPQTGAQTIAEAPAAPARRRRPWLVPALLVLAAGVTWLIAAPTLRDAPWSMFGLLTAASPLLAVSIGLAATGFGLAIALRAPRMAAIGLIATVLVVRLPMTIGVEAPSYSWTYKHFGVVDYIERYGSVDQSVDIYHNWPAAFAFVAWLNSVTGTDTMSVALWFPVVVQLAMAGAVYYLCRSQRLSVSASLVGAFLAHAANWVAQDYMSPQAIAFTLGIVVIALLLSSPRSPAAAWVAVPIFAAIVVAHQLTPYWIIAATVALTVLRRIRPRYLVFVLIAIALGYMALHLGVLTRFGSLLNLDLLANLQTSAQRASGDPSIGQRVNSIAARAVSVVVCGGAAAIVAWRLWRRRDEWRATLTLATIAFSPVLILVGQGYGGEAIFRVFMYSLPGCALIIAPALTALLQAARPVRAALRRRIAATAALTVLTLVSAQAYYGGWFANLVTTESVDVATRILKEEDPHTLTIGVAPGAPGRLVAEYTEFVHAHESFDTGIDTWLNTWMEGDDFSDPTRMNEMTQALLGGGQESIILITRQMQYYNDYYGTLPPGALDNFLDIIADDPRWTLEYESDDILMYRLDSGFSQGIAPGGDGG
ncbi:hypothetical protein [Microbacterium rhizophilus]|uniref:hypothetical protein n=1 Tax=Microbacterium rhizophilus TaxID=3138934 RepID=UPI0031EE6DF0